MVKKYKNILVFLIIAFFLLVPFTMIKTLGADYEIFPAAIFPGGADRIAIDDEIKVPGMIKFFGKDLESGQLVELNKRFMLKKIYIHHIVYFINENRFGPLSYEGFPKEEDNPYAAKATPEDIAQTIDWVKQRLLEQNCSDSMIVVRFSELKLDKNTRKLISDTVVDERILKLY